MVTEQEIDEAVVQVVRIPDPPKFLPISAFSLVEGLLDDEGPVMVWGERVKRVFWLEFKSRPDDRIRPWQFVVLTLPGRYSRTFFDAARLEKWLDQQGALYQLYNSGVHNNPFRL